MPAYVKGDHEEKQQQYECQYVAIKENNACLLRIRQVSQSTPGLVEEILALFSGQPQFSLSGCEVATKALFSLLRRKFPTHGQAEEHLSDFVVYKYK